MEPGGIFEGRYRVDSILGSGGQSRVYRAEELSTGRRVAIKVLDPGGHGVRFIREGRVVSRLKCPHTVRLIEFDRAESGDFFLVFEFVAGENLAVIARRDAPLPWAAVGPIMRQVLEALAEAHEMGIIHRDIKPSNIMLAPGGEAKVLDFGVARLAEGDAHELTARGEVLGTPRYVAPEALSGGEVTARIDVYAVGLVAWELLVGRPANDARNGADIVLKHLDPTPYRLPTDIEIPEDARRWVSSLCNKNPDRRPADAGAALEELDAFEAPPPPLVAQDDDDYDPDDDADASETMVLSADDDDEEDDVRTLDDTDAHDFTPIIGDATDPDPWMPAQLVTAPPAAAASVPASAVPQPLDTLDAEPAPPPPQPRSPGIPRNTAPQRAIAPRPVETEDPRSRVIFGLVVVALVVACATLLWLALR